MPPIKPPRDSSAPAYVSCAEFVARLTWHAQSVVLWQPSDFRDQVLKQGRALRAYPLLTAAQARIAKLLKGKTRLFLASAGAVANLRPDYLSTRHVVLAADDIARECVSVAHAALKRAAELPPMTYVVEVEHEMNFEKATKHQVSSPDYLSWVLAARALSRRDQDAVRSFCAVELEGWWQTEGKVRYPGSSTEELGGDELAQRRQDVARELEAGLLLMSAEAIELIRRREAPIEGDWVWLQSWGLGSMSWPFPMTLDGGEDQVRLLTEATYWDAFGRNLRWLPFDVFLDANVPSAETDALYMQAIEAWATCLEAGQVLSYLAGVLRACVKSNPGPLCDKCFRHVGSGQSRRCRLHLARAAERGQALRLDEISECYQAQLEELRRTLSRESVYANPAEQLSSCWRLHAGAQNPYFGRRNPLLDGRWPAMPLPEAVERLAAGLRCMVLKLAPVVGDILFERMFRLAELLDVQAQKALSETVAKSKVNSARQIEDQALSVEEKLRLLTPPGFFSVWFGSAKFDAPIAEVWTGSDLDHPLVRKRSGQRRTAKKTGGSSVAPVGVGAFSLEAVVRDLVRHRAWLAVGGESADEAIKSGESIPTMRSRRRIDLDQAICLRQKGISYRQIGAEFGVSGPAVYKALNKDG